mmetsp:Transcript_47040/g.142830  ORF Transcript_47040/g.142830 Transcript_47040/m.142830 type:complete len:287 (+) Transcript_47040:2195-3055(+)
MYSFFHSGSSYDVCPRPRRACATVRSPGSGLGSSQGRFMSLGIASSKLCCMASRASRRSLASDVCVVAARARLPSGSLTTWIGDSWIPALVVWPRRNTGSRSWSSISKSSSMSLSPRSPCSGSQSRRSWFSNTPECASCCAAQRSYSDNFFFCRNPFLEDSLSTISKLMPVILPIAGSSSFLRFRIGLETPTSSSSCAPKRLSRLGFRSWPVSWSTSRMERFSLEPAMPMIFTNTSWFRFSQSAALDTLRVSLVISVRCASPSLRPSEVSMVMKAPYSISLDTVPR